MFFDNHFEELAERVMSGDDMAGSQLQRALEPQMYLLVRHALTTQRALTDVARTIVAAVRDLEPDVKPGCAHDPTFKRLASRLSERVVERISAAPSQDNPRETIRQVFCTLAA